MPNTYGWDYIRKWLYKLLYASERPTFFYHGLELIDPQDLLSLLQEKVNQTKIPSRYPNDHGDSLRSAKSPDYTFIPTWLQRCSSRKRVWFSDSKRN